ACVRPERLTVMPLAAGGLHGTVSAVEWQGADLSIAVVIDAAPDEPVRGTMQRGRGAATERGARVSLHCEADDVVLIEP
ncbi:TOBE domain-containing protein, partial [Burkholderia sp. GbtcB21]|uniref:TOBE domain-containing protein n=1 Tax=Burkholderia sp. GbtcB21 TaxID=2824766 RepID=UPI001C2FB4F7